MTRAEMLEFGKSNPGVHLTHFWFLDGEYIYYDSISNDFLNDFGYPANMDILFQLMYDDGWYVEGDKTGTENCKYRTNISDNTIICGAYLRARNGLGQAFMNFTHCECRNCPLRHPELLGEFKLKN